MQTQRAQNFAGILVAVAALWGGSSAVRGEQRAPIWDPMRTFQERICSYYELQRMRVVMQKRDYSCGAAALATIVRYYWGDDVDEETFLEIMIQILSREELEERVENGLALTDLRNIANKAGYQASMGKLKFSELAESKVPVVVGIVTNEHEHFVVFRGTDGYWVYVADPLRGNVRLPICVFQQQWQENAILVVAKPGVKVKDVNPLAPRCYEIQRGWLNDQYVRQNGLLVKPLPALPLVP
jgi:predicted double-glycine peptidase